MNLGKNIPKHIAIIMDGNGRWAKKRGMGRSFGHKEGSKNVISIVEHAKLIGIEHVTLYAFSTENWKRPKKEISYIMNMLVKFIDKEIDRLASNGVKLKVLGDWSVFSDKVIDSIKYALSKTAENDEMILNIALNYGGRDEIIMVSQELARQAMEGKIKPEDINTEIFSNLLYTKGQPDPDLIIRTGSEKRLSNFLTYQSVYSELYFSDVLWPDFKESDLDEAILDYQNRQRRYGGLNE